MSDPETQVPVKTGTSEPPKKKEENKKKKLAVFNTGIILLV